MMRQAAFTFSRFCLLPVCVGCACVVFLCACVSVCLCALSCDTFVLVVGRAWFDFVVGGTRGSTCSCGVILRKCFLFPSQVVRCAHDGSCVSRTAWFCILWRVGHEHDLEGDRVSDRTNVGPCLSLTRCAHAGACLEGELSALGTLHKS